MALVNKDNKEHYIKLMARHFKHSSTEEEIRQQVKNDPAVLEDFVEWLANEGRISL